MTLFTTLRNFHIVFTNKTKNVLLYWIVILLHFLLKKQINENQFAKGEKIEHYFSLINILGSVLVLRKINSWLPFRLDFFLRNLAFFKTLICHALLKIIDVENLRYIQGIIMYVCIFVQRCSASTVAPPYSLCALPSAFAQTHQILHFVNNTQIDGSGWVSVMSVNRHSDVWFVVWHGSDHGPRYHWQASIYVAT